MGLRMDMAAIGQAGTHIACADLIIKGCRISIATEGMPYDVIAERDGRLYKVQVKTTAKHPEDIGKARGVYRFGINCSRAGRAYHQGEVDWFAFVVLHLRKIAYLAASDMVSSHTGKIVRMVEFRSIDGHIARDRWGRSMASNGRTTKLIEEYGEVPGEATSVQDSFD